MILYTDRIEQLRSVINIDMHVNSYQSQIKCGPQGAYTIQAAWSHQINDASLAYASATVLSSDQRSMTLISGWGVSLDHITCPYHRRPLLTI